MRALAILAVVGGLAAALLVAGGGRAGERTTAGALVWAQDGPAAYTPPSLPRDRVVGGEVRNDSLRRIELVSADLRLLDAQGHAVPGVARFTMTPGHGLYPPTRIKAQPLGEQLRLGMRVRLNPGDTAPLVVAWTQPPGAQPPVRVDYGDGALDLTG